METKDFFQRLVAAALDKKGAKKASKKKAVKKLLESSIPTEGLKVVPDYWEMESVDLWVETYTCRTCFNQWTQVINDRLFLRWRHLKDSSAHRWTQMPKEMPWHHGHLPRRIATSQVQVFACLKCFPQGELPHEPIQEGLVLQTADYGEGVLVHSLESSRGQGNPTHPPVRGNGSGEGPVDQPADGSEEPPQGLDGLRDSGLELPAGVPADSEEG